MGPDAGKNMQCESMTGTIRPNDQRGDNIQDSEGTAVCGLELLKFEWPIFFFNLRVFIKE